MVTIRNIRVFITSPGEETALGANNLVLVKVETSEPDLYGLGCATFTQRAFAVKEVVETYLQPLLVGRDIARITDIWHLCMNNGYWRNGPVLNNAVSGIDMALWDIKGKQAGLPLYDLLGGKVREAALIYRHAEGDSIEELFDRIDSYIDSGVTHIRCQLGGYSGTSTSSESLRPAGGLPGAYFSPRDYVRDAPDFFEKIRDRYGDSVELLHDIHERLSPTDAISLAIALEPFDLFFLEDPFSPEQIQWFQQLRRRYKNPIAMGELFVNVNEWLPLIRDGLIDFIRCHISMIGGITPAIKLANFCEIFGVRTAWHGPGDLSPIGHAAQLHLDMASPAFGIQEWFGINQVTSEVFPGSPTVSEGYAVISSRPGIGVDFNEKLAERFQPHPRTIEWTQTRKPDGSLARP